MPDRDRDPERDAGGPTAAGNDAGAVDPLTVITSKEYRKLLVIVAIIGLLVSLAAWGLLSLIPVIQDGAFEDLPDALGFDAPPWWWPLPIVTLAGLITALVIVRAPGGGGGVPADGLASGGLTPPNALPGILLAAFATLGLGLVLGPSSPVIALGAGLSVFLIRRVSSDVPEQVLPVVAVAGSFAALAMVFSSPVIAAVILIEAAGLGGAMLPVILLPGLMAAGIGSLVYLGLGSLTGLSTAAYAIQPLALSSIGELTVPMFAWVLLLAPVAALVGHAVVQGGGGVARIVSRRPLLLVPAAGIIVAVCAIVFSAITGETDYVVLFSGSRALNPIVEQTATLSAGTLALLFIFKSIAWGISMGSFRGGPVFPAIFLGTAGGLLASYLPGLPDGAAIAIVMGAIVVAVLRLPLAAVIVTLLLTSGAGASATPLIIIAVVISHLIVQTLRSRESVEEPAAAPA
jgi:H+/Cl- antiporter ClcA